LDGHIKVMDFGLAKRVFSGEGAEEGETLTAVTQAGTILGTLAYMSPEQVRGEAADRRSDIFSFGIVLFEILAGANPFKREATTEMLVSILSEEAPPLERPGVTGPLRDVIARMLVKDPSARYQSFKQVLRDLRSVAGESTTAPRAGMSRLQKALLALAALAMLVLVLFAVRYQLPWTSTEVPKLDVVDLKVMEYQSKAENLLQDFGDPEALRMSIESWQKVAELKPDYPPALAGMATARTLVAWNSRPDPQLLDQAEREAEEAIELDPQLASSYVALTFIYMLRGLFDTAEEMSRRSLELAPSDPWVLQARARVLIDMHGRFEEAEELARRATELDPTYFPAWFQLGWALMEQRRFVEAEAASRRAIELRPDFLAGFLGMGILLNSVGRYDEALDYFDAALELDPNSVQCRFFGGLTYHHLQRFDQALESFQGVTRLNPDHPLSNLALLYGAMELKRLGRQQEYAVSLAAAERAFKGNLKKWFNLRGMAGVAALQGDNEAALAWLQQAVQAGMKSVIQILDDPVLEPLGDDPRFQEIVDTIPN